MNRRRTYDREDRLIAFAAAVCQIAENLPSTRIGAHVATQLIRCGTAPASNYGEARSAESRRDFIHKMKICLKELRETHVWLVFLGRLGMVRGGCVQPVIAESNELIAIFVKSIATARAHDDG